MCYWVFHTAGPVAATCMAGVRPVFVFEGTPPSLKLQLLEQRHGRRAEAEAGLAAAKEADDHEAVEKYSKRTVRVRIQTGRSLRPSAVLSP
jgi:flap endonuclease-1